MASGALFANERSVYWPSEYADLVNTLKGLGAGGKPSHAGLYKYNTGVIVLAAMVGLVNGRERDVGSGRQEISTSTFESHKLGDASLGAFLFLVPLLAGAEIETLRAERDDELLRKFERFAAGGLEVLQGAMSTSADSTGLSVVRAELDRAMKLIDGSG